MNYDTHFCSSHARADYNMRTGGYVPEWKKLARTTHKGVKLSDTNIALTNYGMYSPAYVTTNGDWRFATTALAPRNKSVLTIAGSGDQPIAFTLGGARTVDTFDISYFAHIITDLKIAALHSLNYQEYCDFVQSLRAADSTDKIYGFDKIAQKCNPETIKTIHQMHGCFIFKQGIGVYAKHMPNPAEYAIAQHIINEKMPFIWSNVDNLSSKLTGQYDLIHLSNIFDHYRSDEKIITTINSLHGALNTDGCVAIYMSGATPCAKITQLTNAASHSNLNDLHFYKSNNNDIIMTLAAQTQILRTRARQLTR